MVGGQEEEAGRRQLEIVVPLQLGVREPVGRSQPIG